MTGPDRRRRDSSGYPDSLPRDLRRARGTYYTPAPIVDHLSGIAARLLRDRPRRSAARILDPAAGNGVFLAAIARRMRDASLVGVEVDGLAVRLARSALGERADLVEADFLAETPPVAGPFDLILGNPPWGGWNRRLGAEARRSIRARFSTARGLLDPFAPFIERSTALLADGGILALVLPDYFLLKSHAAARRHVLESCRIEEIARWGRAFAGVNLDACTLVAVKGPASARHRVRCLPEGPGGPVVTIPQARFAARPGRELNLALDDATARLIARLERTCVRLGDWLEAHEGIHSGNVRRRLFPGPGLTPAGARPGALRPLIFGRDEIRPFRLRWKGRRVLYDRDAIRRDRGEYANLGREEWFAGPKLMIRRTGDRVIAALDRDGLFASNNLFVARARPGCPVPLEYLEGYLNSALATWCFRARHPRAGRLFAELKLIHLNELPVPAPGVQDVARVVALTDRLRGGDAAPGRTTARVRLDDLFARLARLTPAEASRVRRGACPDIRSGPEPTHGHAPAGR